MEHQTTKVADELSYHVRCLVQEANRGDNEARRWLLEAFPGNEDMLTKLWTGQAVRGLVKGKARRVATVATQKKEYCSADSKRGKPKSLAQNRA